MILQRYTAALTSITIVVLSALIAIPSGQLNLTSGLQLTSIGLAAVLTYLLPLLNVKWKGVLKTGVAILAAAISAGIPIVTTLDAGTPFQPIYIALIVLAAVNALGVEVGVNIRTDTSKVIAEKLAATTPVVVEEKPKLMAPYVAPQPSYFESEVVSQNPEWPQTAQVDTPLDMFKDAAVITAVNPDNQE